MGPPDLRTDPLPFVTPGFACSYSLIYYCCYWWHFAQYGCDFTRVDYSSAGNFRDSVYVIVMTDRRQAKAKITWILYGVWFNKLCRRRCWLLNDTRNSPGDEIANVNFLYDDIVYTHHKIQYSCINSATDRRGYVLEHRFTKFSEIMQCKLYSHYALQGHLRSPILVPIERSLYDFLLLVINTNLPPILHRFQVMADYWSNFR